MYKSLVVLVVLVFGGTHCLVLFGQEKDFNDYEENVASYLQRIYGRGQQSLSFREDYPGGFEEWQQQARKQLKQKLGLQQIADAAAGHQPTVVLEKGEDLGQYECQRGTLETEPDVRIPFWLLKPKTEGPWPLAVFPHGHDTVGHHTTAGIYEDEEHKQRTLDGDRDVAVQAVKRGFVAIAPATRGLATDGVPDLHGRHGKSPLP